MNGHELDEHMRTGKRFVIYGDPIFFEPDVFKNRDPHAYYRHKIYNSGVAVNLATEEEWQARQQRGDCHLSEVFRIVEGATRGDMAKVRAYAELLAEKLEADGETNSAKWLRQILDGKAGARIVAHAEATNAD